MDLRERFERMVDRSGECHLWTRATDRDGYGVISDKSSGVKKQLRAPRLAFFWANGSWPTMARHTCDNPRCVNPEHIVDGTHNDNSRDMVERGRSLTGIRNPKNKLTPDQVLEIRASSDSAVKLASQYEVQPAAIYKIRTRRTWATL